MKPLRPPTPGLALANRPEGDALDLQAQIEDFWARFHYGTPKRVTSIFPDHIHSVSLDKNVCHPYPFYVAQSYELAAQLCHAQVQNIVEQCNQSNIKFRDPDFDIENDFTAATNNCLVGLAESCAENDGKTSPVKGCSSVRTPLENFGNNNKVDTLPNPGSVHRIPWIFENPHFVLNGYSNSDIQQGASGDCWWLAALSTITHRKDLMEKICVVRDEKVGVYGFVFHRQGEWVATVVDDSLYLTEPDFDTDIFDATGHKAKSHRKQKQSGSGALLFAKCKDPTETWLPLLEKAYAKIHGDYQALDGGWAGAAMEDLTGGVTTIIASNSILRKERLWDELLSSGIDDGQFIFTVSSGPGDNHNNGIVLSHAYSILEAVELDKQDGGIVRLVKIRNPWGERSDRGYGEWQGAWADGSKEWNTYTMKQLHYEFGDNGMFWMNYEDMLENFKYLYRTRLFDRGWSMKQTWTRVFVPWLPGFLRRNFIVDIQEKSKIVIVLSQLDNRFFPGLQGDYDFTLHFILRFASLGKEIRRVSPCHPGDGRSINCELNLDEGTYEVVPKLIAQRNGLPSVNEIVRLAVIKAPEKLRQIGLQYDLSHAKEGIRAQDSFIDMPQHPKQEHAYHRVEIQEGFQLSYPRLFSAPIKTDKATDHWASRDFEIKNKTHQLKQCLADDSESGKMNELNTKEKRLSSEPSEKTSQDHHWGPVCVIGLRVYAQHANFTVRITDRGP